MDLKTSLLVNRQLPEFVRDEYPLFVSFIEAYYEFLENERYTTVDGELLSQKNNLTEKLKDLRYISDIDFSIDEFETQFFNTFLPYFPKNTEISKDFLIKNVLPLYKSKGNEKSFRFLFRLLFNEEINIEYPRESILRASDGKWTIESILRTETDIYSEYISNGLRTVYYLPYNIDASDIEIYVNDVLFQRYYVRKESRKVIFESIPYANSVIKIYYTNNFDTNILRSRQLTGSTSNTTAIVEKVARRNIGGLNFYQFFIDNKNTVGTFRNGEIVRTDIINEDDQIISFSLQTLSDVQDINITNSGRGYRVGDTPIIRGSASERAIAVIDDVSSGNIDSVSVVIGKFGAGYKLDNEVYANGYSNTIFSGVIDAVDGSGTISPNTFTYNTDLISDYLSVTISDSDYGFPSNTIPSPNINSIISQTITLDTVINLGPALNVFVETSGIASNSNVTFLANSTLLFDNTRISDYNSIGSIKINESGNGYSIGDTITFTNTEYFSGQGAKAFVSDVNLSGGITQVTVTDGGYNYRKDYLPILTVDGSGNGANLVVDTFMGQDVEFDYELGDGIQGKILSIKVLNPGKGYTVTPIVDLKLSGDGTATADANIRSSFISLPGRWIESDGLLSDDNIRLQGENYYIDFSYVISSQVEFQRYKNIVKDMLNPSGMVNYAKYTITDDITSNVTAIVIDRFSRQLAGQINVSANSINVYGNENVYFELANTTGILTEGSVILVNSEMRVVNSIINNTTITVSHPFEYSSNDEFMRILELSYNSLTTEYWRELATTINEPLPRRTIVITTEEEYANQNITTA